MRVLVFLLFMLVLMIPITEGKLIDTPEAVSYLNARVEKTGSAYLESLGAGANAVELRMMLSIPQDTKAQNTELVSVTGPDSYDYSKDKFGNDVIEIVWNNPGINTHLNYSLLFDVEITNNQADPTGKTFQITDMIRATPTMKQKAYELTQGLGDKEGIMKLGSWTYDWIDYDLAFQNTQKTADWIYENRKSVCDGHANLMIAMLRAVGYNAYYVIGYAYTEENLDPINPNYWGPHGWVEVEHKGELITIDPTWAESPVDATHIKFANTPDSNYTEYVEMLASRISLNWIRNDPTITMIEKEERPRVGIETTVIPEILKSESYGMIITDLTATTEQKCVLGRLKIQSCKSGDDDFFSFEREYNEIYFCDNGRVYWIIQSPSLQQGVEYMCPVSIHGMGTDEKIDMSAIAGIDEGDISISTEKSVLSGEEFSLSTIVENHGLMGLDTRVYLFFDGEMYTRSMSVSSGGMESYDWNLDAPQSPGEYEISVFSSTGDYAKETINTVDVKYISIENITSPSEVLLGDAVHVNVTVRGLESSGLGTMSVSLGDNKEDMDFILKPDEEKSFVFIFEPDQPGRLDLSVDVFSGERYEAGFSGFVDIKKEESFFEGIMAQIQGFFSWITLSIQGMIG